MLYQPPNILSLNILLALYALAVDAFLNMARIHHQCSHFSHHESLLHGFRGQEDDHERQNVFPSSAENDRTGNGWKEEDSHIYPREIAAHFQETYLEDIKSEFQLQDHYISEFAIGGTKTLSPYHSVPLLQNIEVGSLCLYYLE